jgi:hypothetical protein
MKNKTERLTTTEAAFVDQINRWTEQGVIQWQRKGDDMEATVVFRLYALVDSDPSKDAVRSLSVRGECLVPLSQDVLVEQFAELEEGKSKTAVAAVAD